MKIDPWKEMDEPKPLPSVPVGPSAASVILRKIAAAAAAAQLIMIHIYHFYLQQCYFSCDMKRPPK